MAGTPKRVGHNDAPAVTPGVKAFLGKDAVRNSGARLIGVMRPAAPPWKALKRMWLVMITSVSAGVTALAQPRSKGSASSPQNGGRAVCRISSRLCLDRGYFFVGRPVGAALAREVSRATVATRLPPPLMDTGDIGAAQLAHPVGAAAKRVDAKVAGCGQSWA